METTTINAQLGQPFLQAEVLGDILSSAPTPPQDLATLPYSIVTASAPCASCDAAVAFARTWEKKLHPLDVLPDVPYNIATTLGGSSLSAAAYLYAVVQTLSKPVVRVSSYLPPPVYGFYEGLCNQYLRGTEWVRWGQGPDGVYIRPTDIDVQVVISPNNPTGEIVADPSLTSPYVLVDTVYDNYLFTGTLASVNPWVWRLLNFPKDSDPGVGMVTSFSKFGPGGFRAGYLFTNTPSLLQSALGYISSFYYGSPTYDYALLEKNNRYMNLSYFKRVYRILQKRQEKIRKYIPEGLILNTNSVAPYLFVNITPQKFLSCGVLVQNGAVFMYPSTYSRISLMLTCMEWKRLVRVLRSGCLFA
jgi:histidinol-phosphate/aromatic aminotransferase/cobyric acid decarboxylase-like protein